MTKASIGIIGLGIMGGEMAQVLLRTGHRVVGYDPVPAAAQRLVDAGGECPGSAGEVLREAEIVIVSLATSAALAATVRAMVEARKAGAGETIVIETSTLPLADKQDALSLCEAAGITLLDCPISGTAARMKDRAWTVYCSGDAAAVEKVQPLLRTFTDNVPNVGVFGNGLRMKFAANHLVAIYNVAYAESMTLVRKLGLDPRQMLDLFGNSAVLGTGVMRLRTPFMIERNYLPATMKVEVWQKDMQVIGEMAKQVDCPTPLFSACAAVYTAAMAQGFGQEDTASVSEVLGQMAGLPSRD